MKWLQTYYTRRQRWPHTVNTLNNKLGGGGACRSWLSVWSSRGSAADANKDQNNLCKGIFSWLHADKSREDQLLVHKCAIFELWGVKWKQNISNKGIESCRKVGIFILVFKKPDSFLFQILSWRLPAVLLLVTLPDPLSSKLGLADQKQ